MKRLAIALLVLGVATPAFAQRRPGGFGGGNIALPIVNVTSVLTSVTVPDGGMVMLGGIGRHDEGRNQAGPVFPNSSISRTTSGTTASVGVMIHDMTELAEQMDMGVVERYRATGDYAEATRRLFEIARTSPNSSRRSEATRMLSELKSEGETRYLAAEALARAGRTSEASEQMDHVMQEFGGLVLTPERFALYRKLKNDPSLAEDREGDKAHDYFVRGKKAEEAGKPEVAKVYYRMAAGMKGTKYGAMAQRKLDGINETLVAEKKEEKVLVHSDDTPEKLVSLARLYRRIDANKSVQFYQHALKRIPEHTAFYAQVVGEAKEAAQLR